MKRAIAFAFLAVLAFGQRVDTDGKAWLSSKADPPGINVSGKWYAGEWGVIALTQADGGRVVTGTAENWNVSGVVSGKSLFFLLAEKNQIVYSVEVASELPYMLNGRYADGTSWDAGTRLMHMTRDASACPPVQAGGQAHIVVYRPGRFAARAIKPSLYCDGQDAALIYPGSYFTIALSPGKHYLSSSDQYTSAALQAETGRAYYARVSLARSEGFKTQFKVELVDAATARNEVRKLGAAKAQHISRKDIITTELPER